MSIVNEQQLNLYYNKYFPYELLVNWLGGESKLPYREISLALHKRDDNQEIVTRYKSAKNVSEFKDLIVKSKLLVKKVDIGAIYTVPVAKKLQVQQSAFLPIEKEYCIDIDISDYDDVRFCGCSGAKYCNICWKLMNCATEVLDYLLSEVFGANQFTWIYSGRRGIHCWVSDENLKKLNNEGRNAISRFIHLYTGNSISGEKQAKKINLTNIDHPTFDTKSKVFEICGKYFVNTFVEEMDIFGDEEIKPKAVNYILNLIYNNEVKEEVRKVLTNNEKSSVDLWSKLFELLDKDRKKKHFLWEIVYTMVYPRLDINVSKGFNHLLKCPFCVHPGTGSICVPIKRGHYTFYPETDGLNLSQLLNGGEAKFQSYIKLFEGHVKSLNCNRVNDSMDF
ncbi:hypothetical protein ABK040_015342 [Willaertia magna]